MNKHVMRVSERITTNFSWRERWRLFLGLPVVIEMEHVLTTTQSQLCYTVFVGDEEVATSIGKPVDAQAFEEIPTILWCDIIE